jgi:hypothetical protein
MPIPAPMVRHATMSTPRAAPCACINAVRHLLSKFDYDDKDEEIVGDRIR